MHVKVTGLGGTTSFKSEVRGIQLPGSAHLVKRTGQVADKDTVLEVSFPRQ
jgi:hypothetical protein